MPYITGQVKIAESFVSLGGPSGSGLRNNAGVLEARNAANAALVPMRGADPGGPTDFVTRQYFDVTPPGAGERVENVSFSFATTSPLVLQAVKAGAVLTEVSLAIKTTFDGTSFVRLGTTGNSSLIFDDASLPVGVVDQYVIVDAVEFPSDDFLILTIGAVGATQGDGRLVYKYKE